jgi:hypothetical protein
MKSFRLLLLILLLASATFANSRDWQSALVINMTETDVTGELRSPKNTVHYTIETKDRVFFADYSFKPNQQSRGGVPDIAVNVPVQVAIEGKHVYILDTAGKEVKLHIVKKTVNK